MFPVQLGAEVKLEAGLVSEKFHAAAGCWIVVSGVWRLASRVEHEVVIEALGSYLQVFGDACGKPEIEPCTVDGFQLAGWDL